MFYVKWLMGTVYVIAEGINNMENIDCSKNNLFCMITDALSRQSSVCQL